MTLASGHLRDNAKILDEATTALHTAIQSAIDYAASPSPSTDTLQVQLQALSALAETCTGTLAKTLESSLTNLVEKWMDVTDQVKDRMKPAVETLEYYRDVYTSSNAKLSEITGLLDDALPKIQTALDASKGDLLNTPT